MIYRSALELFQNTQIEICGWRQLELDLQFQKNQIGSAGEMIWIGIVTGTNSLSGKCRGLTSVCKQCIINYTQNKGEHNAYTN